MDRRVEASHRGQSTYRGRGWRGRGRGGGRPSPSPPSSTASPAALNPTPTPAVPVDDAAPIMGTCPDMCPGNPLPSYNGASRLFSEGDETSRQPGVGVAVAPTRTTCSTKLREQRSGWISCRCSSLWLP